MTSRAGTRDRSPSGGGSRLRATMGFLTGVSGEAVFEGGSPAAGVEPGFTPGAFVLGGRSAGTRTGSSLLGAPAAAASNASAVTIAIALTASAQSGAATSRTVVPSPGEANSSRATLFFSTARTTIRYSRAISLFPAGRARRVRSSTDASKSFADGQPASAA
jgi:hypothetical protein